MLHTERQFAVREVETLDELVVELATKDWCCCCAFRWGRWLFCNDSTGPDGAQEYGLFDMEMTPPRQVETFTIGWMKPERFRELVGALPEGLSAEVWESFDGGLPKLEPAEQHEPCQHCM